MHKLRCLSTAVAVALALTIFLTARANADVVPTSVDPQLIEQAANTGATTIKLSLILNHWLDITGNNLYTDLGLATPPSTGFHSQYWQFQNILNDTGTTITTLTLDMYGRVNSGHPTQTTHFYCGGTVATDFTTCSVTPTSVTGDQMILATWTLSGGTIAPNDRFALNLTNDDISFGGDYRISAPEPVSILLLGSGIAAIAIRPRKKAVD